LKLLQVSTLDVAGGAERVALNLHQQFRERGHEAWLAVGFRRSEVPGVILLDNERSRSRVSARCDEIARSVRPEGIVRRAVRAAASIVGSPSRELSHWTGLDNFDMPASRSLLELPPVRPDAVLCHNLHGGYFDLRVLPRLSETVPVVLLLHDMWTFTGHCGYSLGCERWRTGCGRCPDLTLYPSIPRDATRANLFRKRLIYRRARLHVSTPSRWLMEMVRNSVLGESLASARVIPYGVDLRVFRPGNRAAARSALGLPLDSTVLLFSANRARTNPYKDYATLEAAAHEVGRRMPVAELTLLVVGESAPPARVGNCTFRFVPFVSDVTALAEYYRAADLFLHAAREDNFPNTVLEAQACGVPVVATAVGGIPEQIEEGVTGLLVPAGDPVSMATAVTTLLSTPGRRDEMARGAAQKAATRFGLERHADEYLRWFEKLAEDHPGRGARKPTA
jgi:glycosyltransferase involved in cell wall biosynthesis